MRRFLKIIVVFCLLLATSGALAAQTRTIVISTIDGTIGNIAEKVMSEAYKKMGMQLEVKRLPGERALLVSNSGEVDGELFRKKDISTNFPNLIVIPVVIVSIDEMVFTKDKKFKVAGWDSLLPYSVGYRQGIKLVEDNLVKGTNSEAATTLEMLFSKLEAGRTDVVVESNLSGLETIAKMGLKDITMLQPPIVKSPLFHFLNVKNKNLVEQLTGILQKMEKDGTIQDLQNKAIQEYLSTLKK